QGSGRLGLLLQAGGADARLGGDSLLRAGLGAAALLLRESTSTATRLDLAAFDRTFAQDGSGTLRQGGRETSAGVSQFLFHARRSSNVDLAAGQPFFDYRRTTVSTGFDWIF